LEKDLVLSPISSNVRISSNFL
jgi:scrB_fam: sucrose-6-phosphate hydrolase